MKIGISILANNMRFFDLFLKNLPDNLKNYPLYIFTDTRIGDRTYDIKYIVRKNNIDKYYIITDKDVNSKLNINTEFVYAYTMSLNILMVWYINKFTDIDKALYLDDDILLTDNLNNILINTNHNSFTKLQLQTAHDNYITEGNSYNILIEICNCCNYIFNKDEWKEFRINSGQYIILRKEFNIEEYEKSLNNFFKSELLSSKWSKRKKHIYGFLDERFLSAFFIKINKINMDLLPDVALIVMKSNKIKDNTLINLFNKKSIIHICNNSNKNETYNRLLKLNLIKEVEYK